MRRIERALHTDKEEKRNHHLKRDRIGKEKRGQKEETNRIHYLGNTSGQDRAQSQERKNVGKNRCGLADMIPMCLLEMTVELLFGAESDPISPSSFAFSLFRSLIKAFPLLLIGEWAGMCVAIISRSQQLRSWFLVLWTCYATALTPLRATNMYHSTTEYGTCQSPASSVQYHFHWFNMEAF